MKTSRTRHVLPCSLLTLAALLGLSSCAPETLEQEEPGTLPSALYYPSITYGTLRTLAPGVTYRHASDVSVPWQIDIIEVDLANPNVELVPLVRAGTGVERTSAMAARAGAIAAVNAGYFASTGLSYSHIEVDGTVLATNASSRPARSTFGLSAQHNATLLQVRVDSTNTPVPADPAYGSILDAIGGGPNLVTNGVVDVRDVEEGFDAASGIGSTTRGPRTALCRKSASKKVSLVTVDGRQSGWSVGMTLAELARLLVDLGCERGMNYDGGGSTTAWVNGAVVNRPSDGTERSVVSAWGVVPSFVIDNGDAEFSSVGSWTASANAGFYATESLYLAGGTGANSATWRPNLARSGKYKVYAWWVASSNRASGAPFDVRHALGTTRVTVDQRAQGGQWNLLGTFSFNAGTAGAVTLTDAVPSSQVLSADAVKFVYAGTL
ncbi:MAG TPA: phosphodiester glycosidase family protein [Archangium sp.]|nr:phosphodiester glycosidase family protein [Archangium sp.]